MVLETRVYRHTQEVIERSSLALSSHEIRVDKRRVKGLAVLNFARGATADWALVAAVPEGIEVVVVVAFDAGVFHASGDRDATSGGRGRGTVLVLVGHERREVEVLFLFPFP